MAVTAVFRIVADPPAEIGEAVAYASRRNTWLPILMYPDQYRRSLRPADGRKKPGPSRSSASGQT